MPFRIPLIVANLAIAGPCGLVFAGLREDRLEKCIEVENPVVQLAHQY